MPGLTIRNKSVDFADQADNSTPPPQSFTLLTNALTPDLLYRLELVDKGPRWSQIVQLAVVLYYL